MIKRPKTFARSASAGFDGVFDWDFLLPAFAPTRIQPMDLDAVIERRGQFLVFETKSGELPIPDGQRYTLEALCQTGVFTIIVLRAKTAEDITGWDVWHGTCREHHEGDAAALVEYVKRWFKWASSHP